MCSFRLMLIVFLAIAATISHGYSYEDDDLEALGSDYELDRVQVRVYRGPENEKDGHAAWGYIVKQPADYKPGHQYY